MVVCDLTGRDAGVNTIEALIACPVCRSGLSNESGDGKLESGCRCSGCGQFFPRNGQSGLPILVHPDSELVNQIPKYIAWNPKTSLKSDYRASRRLPPSDMPRIGTAARQEFLRRVSGKWVLNIGSGQRRIVQDDRWVNLDIEPHQNADVVADAHFLPFRDESFDAVSSNSVFEHLRDPFKAGAEAVRVLKPGGLLWCDVPFSYPIHGSPYDFFRYTPDGLMMIHPGLERELSFPTKGPMGSIARFSEIAADSIFPGKIGFVARWIIAWTMFGFQFIDPFILRRNPNAGTSFIFLGRKPGP